MTETVVLKKYIYKKYGFDILLHNAKFAKEDEVWKLQLNETAIIKEAISTISMTSILTPSKSIFIRNYLNISQKKMSAILKWPEQKIIHLENNDFDNFILNHEEFINLIKKLKK